MNMEEYIEMMEDGHILLVVKEGSGSGLLRYEYDEDYDEEGYIQFSSLGDAPMNTCFRYEYKDDVEKMLEGNVKIFKEDEWSMSENDEIISGAEAINELMKGKILRCMNKEDFGSGVVMSGRLYKFEDGKVKCKLGNSDWVDSHTTINRLLEKEFVVME